MNCGICVWRSDAHFSWLVEAGRSIFPYVVSMSDSRQPPSQCIMHHRGHRGHRGRMRLQVF